MGFKKLIGWKILFICAKIELKLKSLIKCLRLVTMDHKKIQFSNGMA